MKPVAGAHLDLPPAVHPLAAAAPPLPSLAPSPSTLGFISSPAMADADVDVAAGLPKKRTFKKFSFRGVDLDALLDMSTDDLVKLFHARARRRFQRGLKRKPMALIKKLRKAVRSISQCLLYLLYRNAFCLHQISRNLKAFAEANSIETLMRKLSLDSQDYVYLTCVGLPLTSWPTRDLGDFLDLLEGEIKHHLKVKLLKALLAAHSKRAKTSLLPRGLLARRVPLPNCTHGSEYRYREAYRPPPKRIRYGRISQVPKQDTSIKIETICKLVED
ncbi:hypothetical protein ACLOJK_032358 [Asimina triloba]